jgi:hypothetical protein
MTIFGDMLRRDRTRWSLGVGQAAWRFGLTQREYRELEAGTRWPSFDPAIASASFSDGRKRSLPAETSADEGSATIQVRLAVARS